MMRILVLTATVLFWLGVGGFALWNAWRGDEAGIVEAGTPAIGTPAASMQAASTPATAEHTARRITPAELARHDRSSDCWLAIDGAVYDVTAYGARHPAEPEVLNAWCGREASEAYRTKGLPGGGRPHSARADAMLSRYRVGTLVPPN